MSEVLACPSCTRKLQVPDTLLGQEVQCPSCDATFVARPFGGAPAAMPPPPNTVSTADDPLPSEPPRLGNAAEVSELDDDVSLGKRIRRRRRADYEQHRGGMILVFGILGLVLPGIIGLVFAIVAWAMGTSDLAAMRAGRMDPEGEGTTNAGRICGIIGTAIYGTMTLVAVGVLCLCLLGAILNGTSKKRF